MSDKTSGIPSREEWRAAMIEKHGVTLAEKMENASVAICGAGGLGSNIAVSLARAGIGRLHIIDFDVLEISNLNRQQYFVDQLGMPKAEALKDNLARIAPYCEVEAESVKIDESNIAWLLENENIVCEAFDKADQKAMLTNFILEKCPEKYLIAGSGMAGSGPANDIRTKKITDRFYICGDLTSDVSTEESLLSARVMTCASHQAMAVIRIIAGKEPI